MNHFRRRADEEGTRTFAVHSTVGTCAHAPMRTWILSVDFNFT